MFFSLNNPIYYSKQAQPIDLVQSKSRAIQLLPHGLLIPIEYIVLFVIFLTYYVNYFEN